MIVIFDSPYCKQDTKIITVLHTGPYSTPLLYIVANTIATARLLRCGGH